MGNWSERQEAKKEVKEKEKQVGKRLENSSTTWLNLYLRLWL